LRSTKRIKFLRKGWTGIANGKRRTQEGGKSIHPKTKLRRKAKTAPIFSNKNRRKGGWGVGRQERGFCVLGRGGEVKPVSAYC